MKPRNFIISAALIIATAGIAIWAIINNSKTTESKTIIPAEQIVMYKNAGCQCCDKWGDYMAGYGYDIAVEAVNNMPAVKDKYHIPTNMESCHTVLIDDYVIEGHVPIEDINRLLSERPDAIGISAPGMPSSSPGMNTSFNEPYDVYLIFRDGSTRIFASH